MEGEWDRFRVFEALHNRMQICNPMMPEDLDRIASALSPQDGDRALDLACGHGELLIRMAERAAIQGLGVDLSPWVLLRAREASRRRVPNARIRWLLGNAHEIEADGYDLVTCLGASWIWHGFSGTVRAMVNQLTVGGRIAVGDLRLRDGVALDEVIEAYGRVLSADEQRAAIENQRLEVVDRLDPGDAAWDAYQRRIEDSVEAWSQRHPGPEADRFSAEQARWRTDHDRDMTFLAWSVWVARAA